MDERKQEYSVNDILNEYRTTAAAPPNRLDREPVSTQRPVAAPNTVYKPQPQQPRATEQKRMEPMPEKSTPPKRKKNVGMIVAIVAALSMVCAGLGFCGWAAFYTFTTDTIFEGVSAAGVDLGGMTRVAAASALEQRGKTLETKPIQIDINGEIYEIDSKAMTTGIDANETAQNAFVYGRSGGLVKQVKDALTAKFKGAEIGFSIAVDRKALTARLDEIAAEALTVPVQPSYEIIEQDLVITSGKTGVDFDRDTLEEEIVTHIGLMDYSPIEVTVQTKEPNPIDLEAIQQEISCEAASATVDKADGKTVIGGVTGIQIDLATAKSIIGNGSAPVYTIPLIVTEPAVTAEELEKVLFRDTLASVSTSLNPGNTSRTNNVRLAASFINGTILNPGEEFSYNGVVGQRTTERGFQSAGAYSQGRVIDEVGGGVCQPSSTLYMAVLRADLEVTERSNHSFTVAYTPLGEDATVSWGSKDFRFVNSTDYPIKIYASQTGSSMNIKLVGTNIDGKKVKTSHDILSTKEFTTVYKNDATLPEGTTKVDQTGSTGYKVVTYKTITVNGETTTVVANTSNYAVRNKTVLLGPGVTVDANGNIVLPNQPASGETAQTPTTSTTPTTEPTPSEKPNQTETSNQTGNVTVVDPENNSTQTATPPSTEAPSTEEPKPEVIPVPDSSTEATIPAPTVQVDSVVEIPPVDPES